MLLVAPEPRNNFSGLLTTSVYLGKSAQYSVRGEDGITLRCNASNPLYLREEDTPASLGVRPEDVMILRPA